MYGNQIVSAELNLYATIYGSNYASYNEAKTLSLYEYNSDWSPSTVKWNNTSPNSYGTLVSSARVTTEWTAFDILPVISRFKTDSDYTGAFNGLLLKADSEVYTTWKKFVSTSGTSTRRPYIEIIYNDNPTACAQVVSGATYYIKNYNSEYLDVYDAGITDNTRLLTYAFNGNANQQFKITNVSGGEYEITPQHTTGKVLSVNTDGEVIIEEDCNKPTQRWYIYYKNGDYHIVNKQYNSGVMGATYDTDYVSINSEYEYCCWELENCNNVIFDKVNQIYILAKNYDITSPLELTLQFIRRYKYNNNSWPEVAGTINQGFLNYVTEHNDSLNNLFCNGDTYIFDSNYGKVDFIHLAATMNGILKGGTSRLDCPSLCGQYKKEALCKIIKF